jgi:enoyl-[acyl-carrier protein] reductase I
MASENYGYMGPVKAALDSALAFLAKSFSRFSRVRFNAVAPSLLKTSASAGIPGYADAYLYAEEVIPQLYAYTACEQSVSSSLIVIRDRRPKYGGPKNHFARTVGMVNAAFADVLKRPLTEADWATIMILDKIARFRGPGATIDGPVDIAGYAACLYEVMDREAGQ